MYVHSKKRDKGKKEIYNDCPVSAQASSLLSILIIDFFLKNIIE